MSKNKTFTIILTIMIILALGIAGFYFYLSSTTGSVSIVPTNTGSGASENNPSLPVVVTPSQPSSTTVGTSTSSTVGTAGEIIPDLRQLSSAPTAGGVMFEVATTTLNAAGKKVAGTITNIRYIEKATGHIFQTSVSDLTTDLLSDTNIPNVRQAFWTKDGSAVYAQYIDGTNTLETYYGKLVPAPKNALTATSTDIQLATMQTQGSLLPAGILGLTLSPNKTSLFFLTGNDDAAQGVVANLTGAQKTQVFSSPFSEWSAPAWIGASTIALTSKPSGTADGFLYFLNTGTGLLSKILGNIAGLTTLTSPDGKTALFSSSQNGFFSTSVYTVSTGATASFPVRTLPEKCVWSTLNASILYCAVPEQIPQALYPDAWYQGLVSFNDDIDMIDLSTGSVIVIAKPSDLVGQNIDAVDLSLNAKETYLMFTNKKDGTLWDLNLAQ